MMEVLLSPFPFSCCTETGKPDDIVIGTAEGVVVDAAVEDPGTGTPFSARSSPQDVAPDQGLEGVVGTRASAQKAKGDGWAVSSVKFLEDVSTNQAGAISSAEEDVREQACVLVWVLAAGEQSDISAATLLSLHTRIRKYTEMFQADILTEEAISGMIRGHPVQEHLMTPEDCCVRMGHLLVRWATAQKFGLRLGVHTGVLRRSVMPGPQPRDLFYGSACSRAFELALGSVEPCVVHLSKEVKASLSALRTIKVVFGPKGGGMYLLPSTQVKNYFENDLGDLTASRPPTVAAVSRTSTALVFRSDLRQDSVKENAIGMAVGRFFSTGSSKLPAEPETKSMTLEEFAEYLEENGVDTSKFGKGAAKPLEEFHNSVNVQESCVLTAIPTGGIQRYVTLVRIMLRCRGLQDSLMELRIKTQATADGGTRTRNQPLAIVLNRCETLDWQDAVVRCFETKLTLPPAVQKKVLRMDMDTYCFKEESGVSDTIPGVPTTYRSHNIVIEILDPRSRDLRKIGLPKCDEFVLGRGQGRITWNWVPVTDTHEDALMSLLQSHGIDCDTISPQAFSELYDEVYEQHISTLDVLDSELVRTVKVLKVWLTVDILNVDHCLVMRAKFQRGGFDNMDKDRPLTMRMRADQGFEDAIAEALVTRLGIATQVQKDHIRCDTQSHRVTEELAYSRSFPGLKTKYLVNEVRASIWRVQGDWIRDIGLPLGDDFSFSRSEDDGETVTHWCWKLSEDFLRKFSPDAENAAMSSQTDWSWADMSSWESEASESVVSTRVSVKEDIFNGRVRSPDMLTVQKTPHGKSSVDALAKLMHGRRCNVDRAVSASNKIRDPSYTCKHFFEDVTSAFPELRLYCVVGSDDAGTTSGRTPDDEYQRTIGALFAVYWLMRLDIDGKDSFCYGLDKKWKPKSPRPRTSTAEEINKRTNFRTNFDWEAVQRLFIDAGLLVRRGGVLVHDQSRTLAMLVLMAIHDIMKLTPILPTVSKEVKEFRGKKAGETVMDHDQALSYVLTYHPEVLPSFAKLSQQQQDAVKFTHCQLDYNMGWLVQAEAPPAMLFRTFREAITAGSAKESDVAFYFVHWFCDLAGAEPTPMEGCDKFVLKFPLKVLRMFLESFVFVQSLGHEATETEVFERYLTERWEKQDLGLGPVPNGDGAVARMRLFMAAQENAQAILSEFATMPLVDREILSMEMALTGAGGQAYRCDNIKVLTEGPAFLVYYGPALLQKVGKKAPGLALRVLAEVYRQARSLWPFSEADRDHTVIVRIDAIKELDAEGLLQPEVPSFWVLCREGPGDAVVKQLAGRELSCADWNRTKMLLFHQTGKRGHGAPARSSQRTIRQQLAKKLHGIFR